MERLTEYHNGVAVIRDKSLLKEAMRKLAGYEDAEEDSDMEKITTEFAEYICDNLCQYPEKCFDDEDLDECCDKCKLGKFICDICNGYNRINRFVGSELEKVMKKKCEIENELQAYKDLEEQGLLIKPPCNVGDTIYRIGVKCDFDDVPKDFNCDITDCDKCFYGNEYVIREIKANHFHIRQFMEGTAKYTFPTKAEAEKALEEMEK